MYSGTKQRVSKIGQLPGTPTYTGNKKALTPKVTVMMYGGDQVTEKSGTDLASAMQNGMQNPAVTWIHVDGLHNTNLINDIAAGYQLHPLTVEDILNMEQRSKVEEFDHYVFITLKLLNWHAEKHTFSMAELSVVLGKDFVITFLEEPSNILDSIRARINSHPTTSPQKQAPDYLAYLIVDAVVDNYFIVLDGVGDQIEKVEDYIISSPTKQNARSLYRLKRQMLLLRKIIWPLRDVTNHILKMENNLISDFTHVYFRDVYDHIIQAIDTTDMFREMLSNMLDIYLSSLTNRLNEVMKVLTIIATLFIPVTFIASIYGMNFDFMPELHWRYGYPAVLTVMGSIMLVMLTYFRRQKWL